MALSASLSRGLSRPLGGRLGVVAAFDPDAAAYIEAVETALGEPITSVQRQALGKFFLRGIDEGWRAKQVRGIFPIWGNEEANAIQIWTRDVGTFAAGMTHGAGYAAGNGTSAYYDFGVSGTSMGLTPAAGGISFLALSVPADFAMISGAITSLSSRNFAQWGSPSGSVRGSYNAQTSGDFSAVLPALKTGVYSFARQGGARRWVHDHSGPITLGTATAADSGTVSPLPVYGWGANNGGSLLSPAAAQLAWIGHDIGMTEAEQLLFVAAVKELWEACTPLSLPAL